MTFQVEFWQIVTLIGAGLGALFTAATLLLSQIDRRLDERFAAVEKGMDRAQRTAEGWTQLEREFLRFQAAIPTEYVRREDYIRGQSVIEAKLDALYDKLEIVQMKGINNG